MPRFFSILSILAVSCICLPTDFARSQDAEPSCKSCQEKKTSVARTIEFELPGIDFPIGARLQVQRDEKSKDKAKPKNQIEIRCECDLGKIPFLANVPYIGRHFVDKTNSHPVPKKCCAQDSECAEGKCECPAICNLSQAPSTCSNGGCNAPSQVELARFITAEDVAIHGHPRPELLEENIELRIENQRLHAKLEAAEQHLEIMREMFEVREENAALRARLEFFEKHHAQQPQRRLPVPTHQMKR